MTGDEQTLSAAMRRVDRPVALEPEAAERVLARALARLDHARLDDDDLDDVVQLPTDRSAIRWLTIAAALLLIIAGGVVLMSARSQRDDVQPADTRAVDGDTAAGIDLPASGNWLGLTPFSNQTYANVAGIDASETDRVISQRVGAITRNEDGSELIELRRAVRLGSSGGPLQPFGLNVRPDGIVDVPLDYLMPTELGGECTGGSIPIAPFAITTTTSATCDGAIVELSVRPVIGAPTQIPLLAEPVETRPVRYEFTFVGQPERSFSSTLWFGPQGLVRLTLDSNAGQLDLDLDIASLILMEETP